MAGGRPQGWAVWACLPRPQPDPPLRCPARRRVVDNLGILTGPQLFSLNKDELKKVCGEEGIRVYSQLTVQKAVLEKQQGGSELEELMNKFHSKTQKRMEEDS